MTVNAVNEIQEPASAAAGLAPPQNLVIHDRTETRIFFDRLLKRIQIVIKALFFISCGAIAIALERLGVLFQAASYATVSHSPDLSAREQPQGIKVPIFPIDNYNQLDPDRIVESLLGLSTEQLRVVRNFEGTHKNRNRILEAIDQHLAKRS
jgi:hypothetical protein